MDLTTGYWPLVLVLAGPILAVIATLAGAVVNSYLTARFERAKWSQENRVRYDEKRLHAYSEYVALLERSARELNLHWRAGPGVGVSKQVTALLDEAAAARWRVVLLGSQPVMEAASDCWAVLMRDFIHCDPEKPRSFDELVKAQHRFRSAAKDELGVK
jgi:hypothetical protein